MAGSPDGLRTARGFPPVKAAIALVLAANALLAFWTYRRYEEMLDYCEGFGGKGLDCLADSRAAQFWFALNLELTVSLLVEISVLVVLGAAWIHRPRPAFTGAASRTSGARRARR